MKVAAKDANILIDLVEGNLLELWFRLGIESHVPDLVLVEIRNPDQRRVVQAMVGVGNLLVGTVSAEVNSTLFNSGTHRSASRRSLDFIDCFRRR